jgi:putative transposase
MQLQSGAACCTVETKRRIAVAPAAARSWTSPALHDEIMQVINIGHILYEAERPNQKWIADFTNIWTLEGWLCVAGRDRSELNLQHPGLFFDK